MPWFQVDDQFHSSKTLRKIAAIEPAAVGLWVAAGSWSSASTNLTDGFVPDDVLPWLFPDALRLAEALVTAQAWRRVKGGHRFIQEGTCKIPPRNTVEHERRQAAERQQRSRDRKKSRRDEPRDSRRDKGVSHGDVTPPNTNTNNPPYPPQAGGRGCARHTRPRATCADCQGPSEAQRHPSARPISELRDANGQYQAARALRRPEHDP